jgi:hypothetical protein
MILSTTVLARLAATGLPVIALAAGAGGKRQCICLGPGAVGEVRFVAKLLGVHA